VADEFGELGRRLRVRAYQVGRWSHATPRKATKVLVGSLIRSTPVDTGTARSNWQVATGATPASVRSAFSPGRRLGIGETRNAAATIADAYARIDRAPSAGFLKGFLDAGITEAAGGTSFYVSNPVYYIDALDKGHSKQQAAGWVRRALDQARFEVRRNKIFDDFGGSA